jgi:hypothetical protein
VGITITHNREANTITLAMPGYVRKALERFGIDPDTSRRNTVQKSSTMKLKTIAPY